MLRRELLHKNEQEGNKKIFIGEMTHLEILSSSCLRRDAVSVRSERTGGRRMGDTENN